jgi:hypothetical protein
VTLDDVIPAPHFSERHERRIAAPPEAVWLALHELRLADAPLARTLMDVRMLPARLLGRARPAMVTRPFLERGPVPVLASDRPRSVVAAGVLQPWKLRGGEQAPRLDAAQLRAFGEPGWVKVAVDFVLHPDGDHTRLSTETRVRATDRGTRLRFGAYWVVIRAGSGLIRREMLRLVAQRATGVTERGGPGPTAGDRP